jgi:heparin binding hemagglutinin HbhA
MPNNDSTKIPGPLYAAAGAGDIAIERLRKLPEKVAQLQEELPGRVSVLQDRVTAKVAEVPSMVAELRQRVVDADTDKLRDNARRNAETFFSQAQAQAKVAQERAVALYTDLVARGEQIVGRSAPVTRPGGPIRAQVVQTPVDSKAADVTDGAKPAAHAKKASQAKKAPAEKKAAAKPRKADK